MATVHRHKVIALMRVADYLVDKGVPVADFLEAQNLPHISLLDSRLWIDRDRCFALAAELSRFTGDPFAACHVADLNGLSGYGRWGAGIRHSRTLGEAIHYAARNTGLFETGRELSLTIVEDRAWLATRFIGDVKADSHQHKLSSLVILKRIVDLANETVPIVVHLPCCKTGRSSDLEKLLGQDLVFDANVTALEFDRDALSLPFNLSRDSLAADDNRSLLSDLAAFVRSVAACMSETAADARPCALTVASRLGVSLRTMQRYLAAWGTTFEEMLVELLMVEAADCLRSTNSSVTEVAFDLGYSDSAHFSRAFRRWTGLTPRDFRRGSAPLSSMYKGVWTSSGAPFEAPIANERQRQGRHRRLPTS